MAPVDRSSGQRYPPPMFVDLATLMQIQSLELRARFLIDGFLSGLHRSPAHGFSVEFTEYRPYVPGDDLRYLDWHLLARSDRYYIKQFEDETNLSCSLLLDNSRSMSFGSVGYSKADYGKTLAGTLACFLTRQRDGVGLFRISAGLDESIPPRFRPGHLHRVLHGLECPPEGTSSGLLPALEEVAPRLKRRGLLVIISDLLMPLEQWETRLAELKATGSDIVLFQILDPAERELSFDQSALFVDAETGQELYIDPEMARGTYRQRLEEHLHSIRQTCERQGVFWQQLNTTDPLEQVLFDFLKIRTRLGRVRHSSRQY